MRAAAELISTLGWGRVTTRAVAERAGLPHGTVSYHFRGKQDLLMSAAMWTFTEALPPGSFEQSTDLAGLLSLLTDLELVTPDLSRLMIETMREAERDPALGDQVRAMVREYRGLLAESIRAEQERGRVSRDLSAEGLAALLAAVGDGLAMHALLDPSIDVGAAVRDLHTLLGLPAPPAPA